MRTAHFRTGPAWRTNLAELAPIPDPSPEPELPREQVMVLLEVRAGGADSLFGKVLAHLRTDGGRWPDCADQTKLCDAGYIQYRRAGRDWGCYVITPGGLHSVGMIARKLARDIGLHHVTFTEPGRRSIYGPNATCCCGHWSSFSPKTQINRLRSDAEKHLAAAAAGTWKAPRPVEDFLSPSGSPALTLPVPAREPDTCAAASGKSAAAHLPFTTAET